jgi:phosphoserine phosphatase
MKKDLLEDIKCCLKKVIGNNHNLIAAFDADGTLWPCDIGKDYFHYQIKKGLLKHKMPDPQSEFDRICQEKGKRAALIWLAQIQSGFSLDQIKKCVSDFLEENPFKVFLFQKNLIHWLMDNKVNVFVVSSSLKCVLDQALQGYDIPKENIIGVQTLIKDGMATSEPMLPTPIIKEKVSSLLEKTKGACPLFVAGNTLADQALLESSTQFRLVVSTAQKGERNYNSERKLLKIAQERSWFYQDGMPDLIPCPLLNA